MSTSARVILLELLFVLVTIGSVIAVAVPKSHELQRRAAAARVISDVEAVRSAVYAFYSDSAYFPAESPLGNVPESLEPYLPAGFSMRKSWGELQYRNWPLAIPTPATPATNVVGVSIVTGDPRVGAMAASLTPTQPRFSVGSRHTFVIFGT